MSAMLAAALALPKVAQAETQAAPAKTGCGKGQIAVVVAPRTGTVRTTGPGRKVCKRVPKRPDTRAGALRFEDRALDAVAAVRPDRRFGALRRSQQLHRLLNVIWAYVDGTIAAAFSPHHASASASGGGRHIDVQHGAIPGPDGKPIDATHTTVTPADDETGGGDGASAGGTFQSVGASVDKYSEVFVKLCPDGNGLVPGDFKAHETQVTSAEVHGAREIREVSLSWEGKLEGHVLDNGRIKDFEYHATASVEVKGRIVNGAGKVLAYAPTGVFRVRVDRTHIDPHNPTLTLNDPNFSFNGRGPKGLIADYVEPIVKIAVAVELLVVDDAARKYLQAEKHWYDDAACLTVDWSPPSGSKVSGGQTVPVEARVKSTVDQSEIPIHLKATSEWGASVSPSEADTAPPSPAQFTFTAPARRQDFDPDFRVDGVSKRGRVAGLWEATLEPPCCTYKILNASFSTHASGGQTGDACSLGGLTSTGTRDFTGVMTTQPSPPVSKLTLDEYGNVQGQILATTSAKWTNDAIHACKFDSNGNLVPCDYHAPDHSPTSGTWPVEYAIDFQPKSATLTGHWAVLGGSIGWVAGGPPTGTDCLIFGFGFDLDYAETAQSQPLAIFTDFAPHTISFSGSKHFESSALGLTQTLDYSWSYSITFQRVD